MIFLIWTDETVSYEHKERVLSTISTVTRYSKFGGIFTVESSKNLSDLNTLYYWIKEVREFKTSR